jgi:hypothetical protein
VALALSEETLARILIAGSGLSVKAQSRLLRRLANAVDPPPPPPRHRTSAAKRAAGRERWHAYVVRHRNGEAVCQVTFSGVVLAKLILGNWLRRNEAEHYPAKQVAAAIADLLREADLPARKNP